MPRIAQSSAGNAGGEGTGAVGAKDALCGVKLKGAAGKGGRFKSSRGNGRELIAALRRLVEKIGEGQGGKRLKFGLKGE